MAEDKNKVGTIAGRITDKVTGKPLHGVSVSVDSGNAKVNTDISGQFSMPNVPAGECTVKCTLPGYKGLSGRRIMVQPGVTIQCDCQLVSKVKFHLDESIVLLPLRLEIRKHAVQTPVPVSVANYALHQFNTSAKPSGIQFNAKSIIEEKTFKHNEYWIRWYPDDIHYMTPVGKISDQEKEDWDQFFSIYKGHENVGSVTGLYKEANFNLSLETLEKFYRFKPGPLTNDERIGCNAYDEAAKALIASEGKGVREVFGWQDVENPEIKIAWIEFAKKYGPVRARQIAKHQLEGNWDFDLPIPFQIGAEFIPDLNNIHFTDDLKIALELGGGIQLSQNVGIVVEALGDNWTIVDHESQIRYSARKKGSVVEVFMLEDADNEPMDILMGRGMSLPTLPEEISLYTVKDSKAEVLASDIVIDRDRLRVAPTDLAGAEWMTDFKVAVEEGMGTIIRDPEKVEQIDQADWLIVAGINETEDSRNVLEEIFRRNNASGELAIVAQDSPTNNSEFAETQFTALETDAEQYLAKTRMSVPDDSIPNDVDEQLNLNSLDSHRLACALHLSPGAIGGIPGGNLSEMTEAAAMASLLWTSCTALFKKIWGNHFSRDFGNWEECNNFFIRYVRARGALPIVRVGENPYGVLPVVSLRDWRNPPLHDTAYKPSIGDFQREFTLYIKNIFLELSKNLPSLENASDEESHDALLEILRRLPVSKRVDVRKFDIQNPADMNEDPGYLTCPLVRDNAPSLAPCVDSPFPETAYLCYFSHLNESGFSPGCIVIDDQSPLLKRLIKHYLILKFGHTAEKPFAELNGRVLEQETGHPLSGADVSLEGTKFHAATDKDGNYVIQEVLPGTYTVKVSLSNYDDLIVPGLILKAFSKDTLKFELQAESKDGFDGPIVEEGRKVDERPTMPKINRLVGKVVDRNTGEAVADAFINLRGTGKTGKTNNKGEFEFKEIATKDHAVAVSHSRFDSYEFTVKSTSFEPNATVTAYVPVFPTRPQVCDVIADAAKVLKRVHPDKLEILLLETLDLFSHRFDAWLTGIANARLSECQITNVQAPPTGVYGWLEKPGDLNLEPPKPEYIQAPSVKQATTAAILRNAAINNGTTDNSGAFQINLSSEQVRKGVWYFEGLRRGHLPGELLGYRLERMIHATSNPQITETDISILREKYPRSSAIC